MKKWFLGHTYFRFLNTHNSLRIFTHIQFSVVFAEKLFSGTLITLRFLDHISRKTMQRQATLETIPYTLRQNSIDRRSNLL